MVGFNVFRLHGFELIGAPYEFDRSPKTKEFPLFSGSSRFTDDAVMTVAAAEATAGAFCLAIWRRSE